MAHGTKEPSQSADPGKRLGVTTGRIYQLVATGIIPACRIVGSIVIPREAWQQWLGEQANYALKSVRLEGGV